MSNNNLKRVSFCTICGEPISSGQKHIQIKTRRGSIYAHKECFEREQRELKAAREAKA